MEHPLYLCLEQVGVLQAPFRASAKSSSSGMLDHRKWDRREASS